MIPFLEVTAFLSLLILLYTYIGYPLLLVVLRFVLPKKEILQEETGVSVSLLISCYNEEDVIRSKLENCLSLDYPKDKLDILVVSDASTDQTDSIVREYEDRGVRLVRQQERMGKTSGLNLAIPHAKGKLIIFSDANAIYRKDAIIKLVRNFHNPTVGYVVGQARYTDPEKTMAGKSENLYWNYETLIKKMESDLHSVVGGDGAIYAIRKDLYKPLLETDINDFVNPLQIILKGYRGIYEPAAISHEEAAGTYEKEFGRKIRIVNRSFSGLMRLKGVMNPFKTGIFAFEIISHKLLRWSSPVFLLLFFVSCFLLSASGRPAYQFTFLFLIACIGIAYLGMLLSEAGIQVPFFQHAYYYMLVNIASLLGIAKSLKGEIISTWNPARGKGHKASGNLSSRNRYIIHIVMAALSFYAICLVLHFGRIPLRFFTHLVFWFSLLLLGYVYVGYPLILGIITLFYRQKIIKREITPTVSLLICAYNEEEVIEEKIRNCLELDYPTDKIKFIIASDGSTDRTHEMAQKFREDRITLIQYQTREGKTAVINKSVPKLDSEVIVFSDANTMCRRDAIRNLVQNFADPSVGAVSANVILRSEEATLGKSESIYYTYERWIQRKETDLGSMIGADGGLYAIRKELFVPPPPDTILDDFVISMTVVSKGYRLVYEQDAVGEEQNFLSPGEEFFRQARVVAGAVQSLKRRQGIPSSLLTREMFCYLSHKLLRWFAPVFLVALFFTNCHLALSSGKPGYPLIMAVQFLFYGFALTGFVVKKREHPTQAFLFPYYFCLMNAAAFYGIYKGVLNKQPVTWHKFHRLQSN